MWIKNTRKLGIVTYIFFISFIQFDIVKHMRQDQITHGLVHAITSVIECRKRFWYNSFNPVNQQLSGAHCERDLVFILMVSDCYSHVMIRFKNKCNKRRSFRGIHS